MDSTHSDLSDPQYQCDFVVSTTQASINADLWDFLGEDTQEPQYLCFLVSDTSDDPSVEITLEDLVKQTGVNPFDIPEDTPYKNNKDIQKLTNAGFVVGIRMQVGVPPGFMPRDLSPVVSFNKGIDKVAFNLYCSDITVIQNSPPSGFHGEGHWNVYHQPEGDDASSKPWFVQTSVDLKIGDLDTELNNSPYLNSHPDIKKQLKDSLDNISSSALSLQQLFFDLDSAILESDTSFQGIPPGSSAEFVLPKAFIKLHSKNAKEQGLPLISVSAIPQDPDPSALAMTAFERIVSPLKDSNGDPVENPTPKQQSATTLDYVCVIHGQNVPSISKFGWNWVQPDDVINKSGVVSINRNVLVDFMRENILSQVKPFCYSVTWSNGSFDFTPGGTPHDETEYLNRDHVLSLEWNNSNEGQFISGGILYGVAKVRSSYSCDIYFATGSNREVEIHQELRALLKAASNYDELDNDNDQNVVEATPVYWVLEDTYQLSIDQNGALVFLHTGHDLEDASKYDDPLHKNPDNVDKMVADLMELAKTKVKAELTGQLDEMNLDVLRQFVFPGAKVFTYSNPFFSTGRDLVCDISYVDPIGTESTQQTLHQEIVEPPSVANAPSAQQKQNASGGRLTASTELMQNYIHGEIVSSTGNFEALQSSDGHALLFSIDSAGVFHVFEEQSGSSHTGWQVHDLSTAVIKAQFPGRSDAVVRTFGVGQSAKNGKIGLLIAVTVDSNDHLFISLDNSNDDTSWFRNPNWTPVPFDAIDEAPQNIVVAGVLFAEMLYRRQYIVVDIQRPFGGGVSHVSRYHIDPTKEDGTYWVKHEVSVDIESANYHSCVGQVKSGKVDGIYTAGSTGGHGQLVFEFIVNWGDPKAKPLVRRLHLPGNGVPSAIATSRNTDLTTDLFAVSGSSLYLFPADKQRGDKDEPILIATNDLFSTTDTLHAMTHGEVTTIWGRNSKYQVYYLAAPAAKVGQTEAWSVAVPILSGIERISPYLNRTDGGNTIFASGNGRLQKLIQNSNDAGRIWRAQEIILSTPPEQPARNFMSYTTSIHVTQSDTDSPTPNAVVNLSANSRTPVHINGLYYVLSTTPIQVSADAVGSLTVVEAAEGINGTVLTISLDDENTVTIDPMDKRLAKITALNSSDKVRAAQVTRPTVPGGIVGSPQYTPLVAASTSDDDVTGIATSLDLMKTTYEKVKDPQISSAVQVFARLNHGIIPSSLFRSGKIPVSKLGLFDWIAAAAGDLFQTLKAVANDAINAVKHVAEIVYDDVTKSLHFLATIGGQVFRAVLDTVDAVVGAVEWVFDKIKTGIEDIIHFVEFLFEWDDIRRTKDVMHNVAKLWLQDQVDNIPRAQQAIDGVIADAEKKVNTWAGITDWSPALGDVASKPALSSGSDPAKNQTSGSKFLADKYRDHASQVQITGDSPSGNAVGDLLNDLITAISQEETLLGAVLTQLQNLANEFSSLSVENVLKKLAAIIVDGVLSGIQVVVDVLLKILSELAQTALNVLDTKIHIPVISDILNKIGVPDLSFMDLFSWIGAVAITLVYKVIENHAPFPGNDDSVKAIISARSWDELAGLFGQQGTSALFSSSPHAASASAKVPELISMSQSVKKAVFESCTLFAGILLILGNNVIAIEAEDQSGSKIISIPAGVIGFLCAAIGGAGSFLVPLDPVDNAIFKKLSQITTAAVIGLKLVFSGIGQFAFKKMKIGSMVFEESRGIGAMLNCVLVIHGTVVTLWHIYEFTEKPAGNTRSAAILGEVANLSSYVSRLAYGLAVNDEEQDSRLIAILTMGLANYAAGGLQIAQAEVGKAALS